VSSVLKAMTMSCGIIDVLRIYDRQLHPTPAMNHTLLYLVWRSATSKTLDSPSFVVRNQPKANDLRHRQRCTLKPFRSNDHRRGITPISEVMLFLRRGGGEGIGILTT
jgi:hypothetical protein